jgi:hypothetical protein
MQILNTAGAVDFAALRKTISVDVPALNVTVLLRELSIAQLRGIENDLTKQLALMIVNEAGDRVFKTKEDMEKLSELSAAAGTLLIKEAGKLNGVSKQAMDDALKNSEAGRNGDSSSDSRHTSE